MSGWDWNCCMACGGVADPSCIVFPGIFICEPCNDGDSFTIGVGRNIDQFVRLVKDDEYRYIAESREDDPRCICGHGPRTHCHIDKTPKGETNCNGACRCEGLFVMGNPSRGTLFTIRRTPESPCDDAG